MASLFQTKIEYLTGVGPEWGALLRGELGIDTFEDLIHHYPLRYQDCSQIHKIAALQPNMPYVQLRGTILDIKPSQAGRQKLQVRLKDDTGVITLLWLRGISWISEKLKLGAVYTVHGKPSFDSYNYEINLIHPEIEVFNPNQKEDLCLRPSYASTEKLKKEYLNSKAIATLQRRLLQKAADHITETLPEALRKQYKLITKAEALHHIHFPKDTAALLQARRRLKFEELFYQQLQCLQLKKVRLAKQQGQPFTNTSLLHAFYQQGLPFQLTGAQKRVVTEIYNDLRKDQQMNRLLQGDVGSGKTMVAFLSMLICVGNGSQAAMMAPTELLAEQHYRVLQELAQPLGITVGLLTGAIKQKRRSELLAALHEGKLQILVGTHALISDSVSYHNLGLAIIDEQHRFGVRQRAQLCAKNLAYPPHVLAMSATPIPRSLAMTFYGDLDVSVIDEMPAGRKPIKTMHAYDAQRLRVFELLRKQIVAGRQVYIVYPLIEESETLDYKNLIDGYESMCRAFPEFPVGIVHGRMYAVDKEYEMQRFIKGETKLMVSTTVIEVGVDIPNATVMVIENAERFGLAQLHQLRGRVGRSSEQAYCVLMTRDKLNPISKERIQAMVRTTDGFEIADVDLKLRGPGDLLGVQQSGALDFKIADLAQDGKIIQAAREAAQRMLQEDPDLAQPHHGVVKKALEHLSGDGVAWGVG